MSIFKENGWIYDVKILKFGPCRVWKGLGRMGRKILEMFGKTPWLNMKIRSFIAELGIGAECMYYVMNACVRCIVADPKNRLSVY